MRATINVPNRKNCSQVINIGVTPLAGRQKKLTLPVTGKQPPPLRHSAGSPHLGDSVFYFTVRVGICQGKADAPRKNAGDRPSPLKYGEQLLRGRYCTDPFLT